MNGWLKFFCSVNFISQTRDSNCLWDSFCVSCAQRPIIAYASLGSVFIRNGRLCIPRAPCHVAKRLAIDEPPLFSSADEFLSEFDYDDANGKKS